MYKRNQMIKRARKYEVEVRSIARNDAISAALRDSCTMEKLKKAIY
jgi:hypothetical protein